MMSLIILVDLQLCSHIVREKFVTFNWPPGQRLEKLNLTTGERRGSRKTRIINAILLKVLFNAEVLNKDFSAGICRNEANLNYRLRSNPGGFIVDL